MGKRSIYKYDDREFSSIKQLSDYTGVHEKTIGARMRRGMTVAEACEGKDLRYSSRIKDTENKSIAQICREQKKSPDLVNNRLRYGYTLDDALNTPKKVCRQGKPIVVHGILYNSIASALRNLNLSHKESTVRRRLKAGMAPDFAFDFSETIFGEKY